MTLMFLMMTNDDDVQDRHVQEGIVREISISVKQRCEFYTVAKVGKLNT